MNSLPLKSNQIILSLTNETIENSNQSIHPKLKLKKKKRNKQKLQQLVRRQPFNRWYNKNIFHRKERIQVLFGILQKSSLLLELQLKTFCLAVNIFDAMISKFPIEIEQMLPVAIVALQVSSKIHEKQGKLISYEDIEKYVWNYGVEEYCQIEKNMISQLNFQINLVTPNDFLQLILDEFLDEKYLFFENFESLNEKKSDLLKLIFNLHLITLVDYEFYKFTSLAVAVSILILSRFLLGLDPWTEKMANFVGISQEHVQDCLLMLYNHYKHKFVFKIFLKINSENNSFYNSQENENEFNITSACPLENTNNFFLSKKFIKEYMCSVKTDISENF